MNNLLDHYEYAIAFVHINEWELYTSHQRDIIDIGFLEKIHFESKSLISLCSWLSFSFFILKLFMTWQKFQKHSSVSFCNTFHVLHF